MRIQVHEGEFVRVHVPAYLERSLQLALGSVHAPFFTVHEGAALVLVLRRDEWLRLGHRFASADVAAGFRLVSVQPLESDAAFPTRLTQALAGAGISATLLPSFHNDHLLVADDGLERCLEVITQVLPEPSTDR